jgi:hypothetical protein
MPTGPRSFAALLNPICPSPTNLSLGIAGPSSKSAAGHVFRAGGVLYGEIANPREPFLARHAATPVASCTPQPSRPTCRSAKPDHLWTCDASSLPRLRFCPPQGSSVRSGLLLGPWLARPCQAASGPGGLPASGATEWVESAPHRRACSPSPVTRPAAPCPAAMYLAS